MILPAMATMPFVFVQRTTWFTCAAFLLLTTPRITESQPLCGSESINDTSVSQIVKDTLGGLFQTSNRQTTMSKRGPVLHELEPWYIKLDADGDGSEDLAVAVKYVGGDQSKQAMLPFNFGSVEDPDLRSDREKLVPAGTSPGEAIVSQAKGNQLFLVIILSSPKGCLRDSKPSSRFVIANVIGSGDYELRRFRGRIEPRSVGDGPVVRPPILKGDAVALISKDHKDDLLVFRSRGWFSWYPWSPSKPQ